ncbi:MAG: hypothetical protein BIFFINMI_02895 [Phycisphaerae bacterium]|nr:hypothetical protein [Phycisphaerae bacterium]
MQTKTQYSVFLVNKPGVLAQVCQTLADDKINIMAMTLVDSSEHGVLRLVVEDGQKAEQSLAGLNLPITRTDVLCVTMPNKPGALADVAAKLGEAHININYAYVTSGAAGGRTVCVLKVADVKKAIKVLGDSGNVGSRDKKGKLRAAPSQRR